MEIHDEPRLRNGKTHAEMGIALRKAKAEKARRLKEVELARREESLKKEEDVAEVLDEMKLSFEAATHGSPSISSLGRQFDCTRQAVRSKITGTGQLWLDAQDLVLTHKK